MPYVLNPFTGDLDRVQNEGSTSIVFETDSGDANPSAGRIQIVGDGNVTTTGAGNVVTVVYNGSTDPDIPTSFPTDSGTAVPANNALNVDGGTNINTSGSGDTVTVNLDGDVLGLTSLTVDNLKFDGEVISSLVLNSDITLTPNGSGAVNISYGTQNAVPIFGASGAIEEIGPLTDGQLVIGNSAGAAAAATLSSSGGTVNITNGSGSINLEVDETYASSYVTDSGTAIPAAGVLNVSGGTNMNTSGATDTLTINLDTDVLNLTSLTCDNLKLDGNTLSSTNSNGNVIVSPNGTGGVVVPTDLTVGDPLQQNSFTINGLALGSIISSEAEGASDLAGVVNHRHTNTAAFGAHAANLRSRGTNASPTVVQNNDTLAITAFAGYDGTDYAQSSQILAQVDGTVAGNQMPGRLVFLTSPAASQTPTEALRLDSSQDATFSGSVLISELTQNAVPIIGASGVLADTGALADGELVIGQTGGAPQKATLTAGDGIDITNAAGSITIAATGTSAPVLLSTKTASSSATIEFTTEITGYDYYLVKVQNAIPASASVHLYVRFSSDSGSSWISTNYSGALEQTFDGGVGTLSVPTTSMRLTNASTTGQNYGATGDVYFYNLASSSLKSLMQIAAFINGDSANKTTSGLCKYNANTVINGIQFFFSSGNIASGTFRLYGVNY